MRAAVFSRLGERVRDQRVLDLYAGGGAMGLEALSRGAAQAVFVERGRAALDALRRNIATLDAESCTEVVAAGMGAFLGGARGEQHEIAIAFADPPYADAATDLLERIATAPAVEWTPAALIVLETSRRVPPCRGVDGWRLLPPREYGETRITMLEKENGSGYGADEGEEDAQDTGEEHGAGDEHEEIDEHN